MEAKDGMTAGWELSRRDFLRVSTGAAASLAVMALPGLAWAGDTAPKLTAASLEQCLAMEPLTMVQNSAAVKTAFDYLGGTAKRIANSKIRDAVLDILNDPAPTLMLRYPSNAEKESVRTKLIQAGLLKPQVSAETLLPPCDSPVKSPQPFFAAPGSGYASHHAYPGGLATHVAVNLKASLGFFEAYHDIFGYYMDKDIVIAAQTLHDLHKPWVFQWQADGSSLPEQTIAGTGAHHVLSVAEAVYRGLPAELVVAMACAHNHPGTPEDEAQVVGWIKAACILAGKDPERAGLLAPGGETLPLPRRQEGFITHLGDHDFVLTVPAAKWVVGKMKDLAKSAYGMNDNELDSKRFNSFRNYVFSQVTIKRLQHAWITGGDNGLRDIVGAVVKPG